MIKTGVYEGESSLPFKVEAIAEAGTDYGLEDLSAWMRDHSAQLKEALHKHGAVLFRGFQVDSTLKFQRTLKFAGGPLLDYIDGNSPRTKQSKGVYTSTEYPADQMISMHNELSYCAKWPDRLYFCCITAPETKGSTTLADCRKILKELDPELVDRFRKKKVLYRRNLHAGYGFGPSWQNTFETEDRAEVEAFCKASEMDFQWNDDDSLTVIQHGKGVHQHPETKEEVWFNQADQFHPTNHPEEYREAMLDMVDGITEDLPSYATYGDGSVIEDSDLDQVRKVFERNTVHFPWQRGDFLIVDNVLVAHGRDPYTGPRRILVAMS